MRKIYLFLIVLLCLPFSACEEDHGIMPPVNTENKDEVVVKDGKVIVNPQQSEYAFRNPMKGFREFFSPGVDSKRAEYPLPYGTMVKEYMQWNKLENLESDGVDKIIAYSNHRWEGVEDINMKVIPRIYIVWREAWNGGAPVDPSNPDGLAGSHWPSDIPPQVYSEDPNTPITGGYFDPKFQDRVKKLVAKAGQAWDNDPRVAYVELGIVGEWGEHHDPSMNTYWKPHNQATHVENRTWIPGIEKTLGDAFTAAFKNKKVMVRYAYDFKDYEFGIHWDSWAMPEENDRGYNEMKKLNNRWKIQPIGGELTWDWGTFGAKFKSLDQLLADAATRKDVISKIRDLHCNHLGGVTWTNFNSTTFIANGELLQKTMGYRFVISDFTYPTTIKKDEAFTISFDVTNIGSSPFYYDWPVEIALLDATSHIKVWSKTLASPKISQWMPGDNWNELVETYTEPAKVNHIEEKLTLDQDISKGEYIISLAVLDPAGMLPSLRFAMQNYYNGGRHPIGMIGVNTEPKTFEMDKKTFNDIKADKSLKYVLDK